MGDKAKGSSTAGGAADSGGGGGGGESGGGGGEGIRKAQALPITGKRGGKGRKGKSKQVGSGQRTIMDCLFGGGGPRKSGEGGPAVAAGIGGGGGGSGGDGAGGSGGGKGSGEQQQQQQQQLPHTEEVEMIDLMSSDEEQQGQQQELKQRQKRGIEQHHQPASNGAFKVKKTCVDDLSTRSAL